MELQAGYLLTYGTKTTLCSIHFYTNARVLVPFMMQGRNLLKLL